MDERRELGAQIVFLIGLVTGWALLYLIRPSLVAGANAHEPWIFWPVALLFFVILYSGVTGRGILLGVLEGCAGAFSNLVAGRLRGRQKTSDFVLIAASLLGGLGTALLLYAFYCSVALPRNVAGFASFLVMCLYVPLAVIGATAHAARRAAARIYAVEPLPENYILFLRSYQTDNVRDDSPETALATRQFTEEEDLVEVFSTVGPVVAFDDPRARIPPLGSFRARLPEDWKPTVRRSIEQARLIILRLGSTASLRWELDQVVEAGALGRTLLVVPRSELTFESFSKTNLLEIDDPQFGKFVVPRNRRLKGARFIYLDRAGDLSIAYMNKARIWRRFNEGRLYPYRDALVDFARQHELELSRRARIGDVGRAALVGCYVAWSWWSWGGPLIVGQGHG